MKPEPRIFFSFDAAQAMESFKHCIAALEDGATVVINDTLYRYHEAMELADHAMTRREDIDAPKAVEDALRILASVEADLMTHGQAMNGNMLEHWAKTARKVRDAQEILKLGAGMID